MVGSGLEIVYRIDSEDRISAVSPTWGEFAMANQGAHLVPPPIIGERLWDSIGDPTTRSVYRAILDRIRKGVRSVHFHFRCDAPGVRRLLDMGITLEPGGEITFSVQPVAEQLREAVTLLDPFVRRTPEILSTCSWCMRVSIGEGEWAEVEEAIGQLGLFEQLDLPRLSHGMCPTCHAAMMRSLELPVAGAGTETIELGIGLPA